MNEPMHPVFTGVPQRSYDALVRNGTLEEVLLALITDPLAAEDVADELESKTRKPPSLAPSVFADLGANALSAWRITITQWVMTQDDARPALQALVTHDRRLGAWCACQVARESLRYVPAGEERPRIAIETTEAWAKDRVSIGQVRQSAYAANYAAENAADNAAYTVYFAAYAAAAAACAAYHPAYASDAAANAVGYAASASASASARFSYESAEWTAVRGAELIRLREVVAAACLTFPVEAMR